jgi:uncharacterized membrane protein YhaH (DUF805 family)
MSAESFLSSAVEIAVGLAGFAGIIAAIRQRGVSSWAREQQILLRMLLTASAMAITFALLPPILVEAQVPQPAIWRIGSLAFILWQIGIAIHRVRQFRESGTQSPIPRIVYAWIAAMVLLQAFNVVLGVSWPYLLARFALLVNSFVFFLILLLGRTDEESVSA